MASRMVQRCLHTAQSCLRARVPRRANPGLGYQLQQLQEHERPTARTEASEDYADLESDFMDVQKTHRQHEAQQQAHRDRVRQLMIKHKYFRDVKLPNLLLHAEKEQMRLLHERRPDEWTIERLAESFPATPEIVQKVLRAKWRPRNVTRIRAHDESVMKNWQQLRQGKCEVAIPSAFLQHLEKFSERRQQDLKQLKPEEWPTRPALPVPQGNEFRQLLGSGTKSKEDRNPPQLPSGYAAPPAAAEDETYLLDKVRNKRKMRLQELKELQLVPAVAEEAPPQPPPSNPSGTGFLSSYVQKFESSEIVISAADQQRYEMTKVKDRIVIPRKLHRAGATYRVEDAYYHDDGELLYRVPGMKGGV
ncbi:GL12504 [Drosophila persimilis]|uniref:GL12504 n=1 Tax=Drosophila persimilis TaxID=7234 RepID=B4GL50_DROPE|nr:neugrin [Drosophila persimilis]EDW38274.1 GL12504 [Drosophila persimilis]